MTGEQKANVNTLDTVEVQITQIGKEKWVRKPQKLEAQIVYY